MASFEDLMKALSPVDAGAHVCEVASSARMNAMMEAIKMLIRGENIMEGANVRKDTSQGKLILTVDPSRGNGGGGGGAFPFKVIFAERVDFTTGSAVQIYDGKVNNEWPDVGTDTMGSDDSPGYQILNIANVENCNVFLRVMFNAVTNAIERLDIFERPNETFPPNQITYIDPSTDPEPGACDSIDSPDTPPPAGYGAIQILLAFTYMKPPPTGSPAGTLPTAQIYNLIRDNIEFEFMYGAFNGAPAVLPVAVYSKWTAVPFEAP